MHIEQAHTSLSAATTEVQAIATGSLARTVNQATCFIPTISIHFSHGSWIHLVSKSGHGTHLPKTHLPPSHLTVKSKRIRVVCETL